MSDLDEELVLEFQVEAQEHLGTVEPALLEIEGSDAERRNELLHSIFRAVHSVKGASGFFGLDRIQALSHTMESLLMRVRDGEIEHTSAMTDTLLTGLDLLATMIGDLPAIVEVDARLVIEQLVQLTNGETLASASEQEEEGSVESSEAVGGAPLEAEPAGSPAEVLIQPEFIGLSDEARDEAKRFGRRIFLIRVPHAWASDAEESAWLESLEGLADVLSVSEAETEQRVLVTSVLEGALLAGSLEIEEHQVFEFEPSEESGGDSASKTATAVGAEKAQTDPVQAPKEEKPEAGPKVDSEVKAKAKSPDESQSATAATTRRAESNETVRVSVHLLDRLMDQAGELVLSRNQLLRNFAESSDGSVKGILQDLDLITSELQGDIMKTRMQPIGGVFNKFGRIVRDLSRKLDKRVRLEIEGADVELDKSIVELLSDPLTHLIRNSLDHGIETVEGRKAAGKPEEGTVQLRAFHEGGQVHIEIEDDGAGIDPDKMRNAAVGKGVLSEDDAAALSDADARMLIFAPGFSTAETVSDVSGRGVGMDVVKTNISKLGGKIEIESELNLGTRLTIALPLTLAIIPSLVVEVDDDRLAIPQVNLVELVRVKPEELKNRISSVSDAPVLKLRGSLLPLVCLKQVLGLVTDEEAKMRPDAAFLKDETLHIVVLQIGGTHFGLSVDAVLDSEEIVVKPLSSMIDQIPIYSGATIMGDGRVAMILDVHGIAEASALRLEDKAASTGEESADAPDGTLTKRSLVLFNNAADEQFAIDLARLIRLECISPSQIETVGNHRCIQYLGEGLPLLSLEDELPVRPIPDGREELYVLIPSRSGKPIGILVGGIVDAVEVEVSLDTAVNASPGIEGRALIGERLTLILDPDHLGRTLRNEEGDV